MKTRIKICGITRVEDALAAVRLGADALGFVFFAGSPRHVTLSAATAIIRELPPFVTTVGLFVNPAPEEVEVAVESNLLSLLQFHGDEPDAFCNQFAQPYIKAVRVGEGVDLLEYESVFPGASGLLLDAFVPGTYGGTGHTFDWQRIPRNLSKPVILSGGLTTHNVHAAVQAVRPWAVDVSSGVESAVKGVKDHSKLMQFIDEVHRANV